MATECTKNPISIPAQGRRTITADFDGGNISSDAGMLLLKLADDRDHVLDQFARCFRDHRDPSRIEHSVRDLVAQRVFAIALGYEDVNDHDELRRDPLLASVVGKKDPTGAKRDGASLAASSTLNRLELSRPGEAKSHRYKRVELDGDAVDDLLSRRTRSSWTSMRPTRRSTESRKGASSTATTATTATCRSTPSAATTC